VLRYISLNKCSSREQELSGTEREKSLVFDSSGHIKLVKTDKDVSISVSSDMQVKDAMYRRALAYDQAGFISYDVLAKWILRLFEAMMKEAPFGYRKVSLDQVLLADKELFKLVAEETNAAIAVTANGNKPVDASICKHMYSHEVTFHLLPLPVSSTSRNVDHSNSLPIPVHNKFDKGKVGKNTKGKGKGSGKNFNSTVPEGCSTSFQNKPLCFNFNRTSCSYAKPGKRCRNGWHLCWKKDCGKAKSFKDCNHSS
jgi:hypothetical protein